MRPGSVLLKVWLIAAIPFAFNNNPALATATGDTVRIGLLIRTSATTSAYEGAMLAASEANTVNGGKTIFDIVVKSMDGPWGTGSKMTVDLIFNHKVAAIIGAVDGRNGHLAEQACTKTQVVMLSVLAADPTLSQAFVPWFFNCVPNDRYQADALAEEIFNKQQLKKIVIAFDKDYDSGFSLKYFRMKLEKLGKKAIEIAVDQSISGGTGKALSEIAGSGAEAVVIFCKPSVTAELCTNLKRINNGIRIFASASSADDDLPDSGYKRTLMSEIYIAAAVFNNQAYSSFRKSYLSRYKKEPGLFAAYTYDATHLLIKALTEAGRTRENIQPWLYSTKYNGITGSFGFDKMGNRNGQLSVIHPASLKGMGITYKE